MKLFARTLYHRYKGRNRGEGMAYINIFGTIGREVLAIDIVKSLELIKSNEVTVNINSQGGSVTEGFAIHDILSQSGKTITTNIVGICASIATIIALAGEKRIMSPNSQFMIHNPWMDGGAGDADSFEKRANRLRETEDRIAEFYAQKTGIQLGIIKGMMKEESFLSPERAIESNFITEVLQPVMACAYLPEESNRNIESNIMAYINEEVKSRFDAIKALFTKKEEPKKEEIQNWELALEDGRTLTGVAPKNPNGATVGDSVKLKNSADQIEDGEYVFAESKDSVLIKDGKIDDIYRVDVEATKEIENSLIETIEAIATGSNDKFAAIEARMNEAFENVDKISALLTEKEEKFIELSTANEALKAELHEMKASIGSTYTPPASHEVQANGGYVPADATTLEIEKIKNRNK